MTWVCSMPTFMVGATFLSDTSVSVNNTVLEDITVQKLHRLGMCALAGFSGYIEPALEIIEGLNESIDRTVGVASHDLEAGALEKLLREQSAKLDGFSRQGLIVRLVVAHLRLQKDAPMLIHGIRRVVCTYTVDFALRGQCAIETKQVGETIQIGSGAGLEELSRTMKLASEKVELGYISSNRPLDHLWKPLLQAIINSKNQNLNLESSLVNRHLDIGYLSQPICFVTGLASVGSEDSLEYGIDLSNKYNDWAIRKSELAIRGWGELDQHLPMVRPTANANITKIHTASQLAAWVEKMNYAESAELVG